MPQQPSAAEVYRAWVIIHQAALLLQQAVDTRLRVHALDYPQAAVLAVLRTHGPQPMGALGRSLLYGTVRTTSLIDRLERAGLVRRSRHPTDRRSWLVALTEAGTAAAAVADTALAEVAATTVGAVAAADGARIAALLPRVRDAAAAVAGMPSAHFTYATETLALRAAPTA